MKVLCTHLPVPVDEAELESSPWVTMHSEYTVVSMLAEPSGQVQIQIVTDDGHSLGWFDSTNFLTTDGRIPGNWTVRLGEKGALELAPAAWLEPGFWEAYYDANSDALEAVAVGIDVIMGEGTP